MKRKPILYIILSLIIIYVFRDLIFNTIEKFQASANEFIYYESPYKSSNDTSTPIYYNEIDYQPKTNIKCCLLEKKYLPDNENIFGGSFEYKYNKLENEMCDLKKFRLDSNKQMFFDGVNNWSNDSCREDNNKIGSCRNVNKECIDFVDKEFCDRYNMMWTNKTCHDPFEYKWIDKIKFVKPEPIDDGTFIMFNKQSNLSKLI